MTNGSRSRRRLRVALVVATMLAVGGGILWWSGALAPREEPTDQDMHAALASTTTEEHPSQSGSSDIAYYSCSMHPSVHSNTPGKCPICGMDLVPVLKEEVKTGVIEIDARRRQLIGVETGRVERKPVTISIRAVGTVTYDETRLADVTLKYRGWIGKVFADYTGVHVQKGQPLFTVYAPELLSAQEEFLESLHRARDGTTPGRTLLKSARRRLRLWNMTDSQIAALAESGTAQEYVAIVSPVDGTVIEKNVVQGSAVNAGMRLYRIADLSTVWVDAQIYESDLPLVVKGQTAEVQLSYLPGERFSATVSDVYPYLDAATRTARVRLDVPNPDGKLRPDMYAEVSLEVPRGEQLVVPEAAVIMAGKTDLVFLDLGKGRLKPQKIEIGRKGADGYVVLSGLNDGDVVVTAGNFLVAAESKLKSGVERW
jgi:Cu(I)/Ag(I) efflux system membrane fusion protein